MCCIEFQGLTEEEVAELMFKEISAITKVTIANLETRYPELFPKASS